MGSIVESSGETRLQVSPLWVSTPTSRLISKRSPCRFLFKRKIGSGDLLSGKTRGIQHWCGQQGFGEVQVPGLDFKQHLNFLDLPPDFTTFYELVWSLICINWYYWDHIPSSRHFSVQAWKLHRKVWGRDRSWIWSSSGPAELSIYWPVLASSSAEAEENLHIYYNLKFFSIVFVDFWVCGLVAQ